MASASTDLSYYASRADLINWTNGLLQLQLSRLEQFASGAVFCQILDAHFPGVVPISKVNFFAKEEHEIVSNYKQLQVAFTALEINRDINVKRLSKASTVDTLELLQWLHKFCRRKSAVPDYDARHRRIQSVKGGTDEIPLPSCVAGSFSHVRSHASGDARSGVSEATGARPSSSKGSPGPAASRSTATSTSMSTSSARPTSARPATASAGTRPSTAQAGIASRATPVRPGSAKPAATNRKLDLSHVNSRYKEKLATPPSSDSRRVSRQSLPSEVTEALVSHGSAGNTISTQTDAGPLASTADSAAQAEALENTAESSAPKSMVSTMAGGDYLQQQEVQHDTMHDQVQQQEQERQQKDTPSMVTSADIAGLAVQTTTATSSSKVPPTLQPQTSTGAETPRGSASAATHHGLPPDAASLIASTAIPRRPLPDHLGEAVTAAMEAASQAGKVLQDSMPKLQQSMGVVCDKGVFSHVHLGKIRSLENAIDTLSRHTALLLSDVEAHCSTYGDDNSEPIISKAKELLQELQECSVDQASLAEALRKLAPHSLAKASQACAARPLTEEHKALCNTQELDASLKAVGIAHFNLAQAMAREVARTTASFLAAHTADASTSTDHADAVLTEAAKKAAGAGKKSRAFKLGDYQLKQLKNGDIYKGRYVSNKKSGEGVYQFVNNDVYEGEFKDDRMDGCGVYTFSHEGRYEGQWKNAVYSGHGTETFAKGSTYHGEYAGGLRNGWGVCRFYNGDYYEGQWVKGLRDGRGMQQCTDDSNYVGEYQKGKRHGYGVYSFPNGDCYVGQYQDDLPHGYGVYYFASGQRYEGHWEQGKKHGWSIYTVDNGGKFVGSWSAGKPEWVSPLPSDETVVDLTPVDEETARTRASAHEAQGKAQQAAFIAHKYALEHWQTQNSIQTGILNSLQQAKQSATVAQASRQQASIMSAKLDAAIALLHGQGSGGAPSNTTGSAESTTAQ